MTNALAKAREYGVGIRFADLGDWGGDELRAEYDAQIPEIRLNIRIAAALPADRLGDFVALAVGHELYHHRERIGEVPVVGDRGARESAADEFARNLFEHST
jgi:hypothetical protein